MPVSGARPMTALTFTAACPQMSAVMPAASSFPNGSLQASATLKPAYPKTTKAPRTAKAPNRPSSSPMMAKIMSVDASGR
jgi:hypothetical protein